MSLISIIIPCYNEEDNLDDFYTEFLKVYTIELSKYEYELIFINDGSKDKTLNKIKELSKKDINIRYISFSRNFGKESALYAGLESSTGNYVAVMDADLQDPPCLLPKMLKILENEDYDIVATRRSTRTGEPKLRSFFARTFYKIINKLSDVQIVDGARDYRVMTRQVVNSLLQLDEYNRFSKGLFSWVGFNTKWLEYENIERTHGETSWSFFSLFKYSIEGIVAFSTVPLYISTILGTVFSILAFIMIIIILIKNLLFYESVQGWTSTICAILLLGGIQLLSIGILGLYLEKTYTETKKRPIYVIKESNFDD